MIIANRAANPTFSTDAVAYNVRSVLSAPVRPLEARRDDARVPSRSDFAVLYPQLFASKPAPVVSRLVRAAAVRVSILGTAAAFMLGVLHH